MAENRSLEQTPKRERKPSNVKRGRKIYDWGDRINLNIPDYIDKLTLDWINAQPQVATKIWEIVIKAAHGEVVHADPLSILKALGLDSNGALSAILQASQNITNENRKIKSSEQNTNINEVIETTNSNGNLTGLKEMSIDAGQLGGDNTSGEESIDEIDDEYDFHSINLNKDNIEIITPKPIEETKDINIYDSNKKDKLQEQQKDNKTEVNKDKDDDLYRKDGHMNLKSIATKTGGSRRGLSRNTGRTQLDANKPNLMEQEIFGKD